MTTKTDSPTATGGRTEDFKHEVKSMKIKDPSGGNDQGLVVVGLVVMALGIVLSIIGYALSTSTSDPLKQNDALTVGIIGVSLTVAGAAVFLRYSFAQFLRFWLARFIYEARNRD